MFQTVDLVLEDYLTSGLAFIIVLIAGMLIINRLAHRYFRKREEFRSPMATKIVSTNIRPLYLLIVLGGLYVAYLLLPYETLQLLAIYQFYILGVFAVLAVLLICFAFARWIKIFVEHWFLTRQPESKMPATIMRIVGAIIFFVGLTVLLGFLNVNIWPIVAGFLIGGIAAGLALQGTLSNLFAGMHLASTNSIQVGDSIEIEGTSVAGVVQDVGWASTRIQMPNNVTAVIPNSKLTAVIILNHGSMKSSEAAETLK
ncbi:MAG TPA: mechanosensitive ion channel domain-containing protein [Candidatus Lokiarchaeia archaeon]|nr:mechanosensitive ion channel domain-containing protein [Candidatus Lokiarchaeia archaeon]